MRVHESTGPGTLRLQRTDGVLVVGALPASTVNCLVALDTSVQRASNGAEALELFDTGRAPRMIIVQADLEDMTGTELCQRLRADSRSATTYIIQLAVGGWPSRAKALQCGADDHLPTPADPGELREVVRCGLRRLAVLRVALRNSRRDAMAWLAAVIAHEVNNPLAVARSNIDFVASEPSSVSGEELEALEEATVALGRIGEACARLQGNVSEASNPVSINGAALTQTIKDVLFRTQPGVAFESRGLPAAEGWVDVDLLLEGIERVLAAARPCCDGRESVTVYCDSDRVVVLLELENPRDEFPERVLEPTLAGGDGVPRFDPGLTWFETRLAAQNGQLFTSNRQSWWRFGILLPMSARKEAHDGATAA